MKQRAHLGAIWVLGLWPLAAGTGSVLASDPSAAAPALSPTTLADLQALEDAFVSLAERAKPSVVTITAYDVDIRQPGQENAEPFNHGSGFVVSLDGHVATSFHVVEAAAVIRVTLADGSHHFADLVGADRRSDLAVIRIRVTSVPVLPIADVSSLKPGQWAFTVGNPYGVAAADGNTAFSMGVVSALGKSLTGRFGVEDDDRYFGNLIQTTLNFHPGNSGGPVLNISGEVIGIAAATFPEAEDQRGNSFAIPMSQRTRRILDSLKRGEAIQYGALGARTRSVGPDETEALGVATGGGAMVMLVSGGGPKNPAARAGLRRHDVITSFDGQPITSADDLLMLAGATPVGRSVPVTYFRDGERRHTTAVLVDRAELGDERPPARESHVVERMLTWRGAMLIEPNEQYLRQHDLPADTTGLYVRQVTPGTLLHERGVRPDVFIVEYDGTPVRTIDEFIEADDTAGAEAVLVLSTGTRVALSGSEQK